MELRPSGKKSSHNRDAETPCDIPQEAEYTGGIAHLFFFYGAEGKAGQGDKDHPHSKPHDDPGKCYGIKIDISIKAGHGKDGIGGYDETGG